MIEWVEELRAGFAAEFGTGPKVVTLASVDERGIPRARSVIVRSLTDDATLVVASDARHEKNRQLAGGRYAEVCAWLPAARRQFRITCRATVIGGGPPDLAPALEGWQALREQVWTEMSEATRATFFWPDPGMPRVQDPSAFPPAVRTGLPPTNFELLYLRAEAVDVLETASHPHRRRRWRRDTNWAADEINP
jgi:pyridoxamine 5'-phosphate oxidase